MPVILLSARAGQEARIEGLQAGADDYLVKPFTARELLASVASQLRLSKLRRESEAERTRLLQENADVMATLNDVGALVSLRSRSHEGRAGGDRCGDRADRRPNSARSSTT